MKNNKMVKTIKVIGLYALLLTVCTVGFVTIVSAENFQNESERPAPTYPVNDNNKTYGSLAYSISEETEPDLILVEIANGSLGYVKKEDLREEEPNNPEEAVNMQKEKENRIKEAGDMETGRTINVYDVNGEVIIGEFFISDGLPTSTSDNESFFED